MRQEGVEGAGGYCDRTKRKPPSDPLFLQSGWARAVGGGVWLFVSVWWWRRVRVVGSQGGCMVGACALTHAAAAPGLDRSPVTME